MKDPNLSELVRTCIRCWLYLVPQAFLGIHLFDMFMRRKNSIKPLMIWQLLRVFLIGGISDIILRGYYGDESWWGILMMFCSVVIMIANTVLIYYTFEGSLPKVAEAAAQMIRQLHAGQTLRQALQRIHLLNWLWKNANFSSGLIASIFSTSAKRSASFVSLDSPISSS